MALDTQVVDAEQLIVKHLELWTSAQTAKSTAGRGSNNKIELTGIKKLRELILELAVRGKLVPQDPNDEPASELLKRIEADKDELFKAGKQTKQKPLPAISDEEKPFKLPHGWLFLRLGSLIEFEYGHNLPEAKRTNSGEFPVYGSNGVVGTHNVAFVNSPCIVIGRKGSAGALNLNSQIGCCVTDVAYYCVPSAYLDLNYVFKLLHTLGLDKLGKGIKPGLNRNEAYELAIGLPPFEEQKRINLKVEELMVLCDQLEKQSYQSIDAHNQLVDTLLQTLVDSANADELASNWQRLSEYFDTLFTTEYSIDALKQTILQLAVMGKLVKQDPTDEPASELLKRIAKEKEALVKAGKIKKQKPLPPITDNEKPFELPKGWEWCRLPDLGELSRGKSKHRPRNDPRLFKDGIYPLVQTGDVARADKLITSYASTYNDFGLAQSRLWPIGTLCITIAANIADTGILGIEACFPDSVVGYLPYSQNMPVEYFDYFIKVTKDDLERFAPSTAQKNINLEILGDLLVPCPPEDEIRRIVSKVEDLFNLCDNAKSKILESNNTQAVLAEALVEQNV